MVCMFHQNMVKIDAVLKEWRHFKVLKWKSQKFNMAPSPWKHQFLLAQTKHGKIIWSETSETALACYNDYLNPLISCIQLA